MSLNNITKMFTELTFLLFYKNLSMNLVHMYKVNFLMQKKKKHQSTYAHKVQSIQEYTSIQHTQ